MLDNLDGFFREMEKRAISMGKTLAAVKARVAQGAARVGPGTLRELEAEAAKGLPTTSRESRRAALYAAESAQAHRKMQQSLNNPVTQAFQGRAAKATNAAQNYHQGVYDYSAPLPSHYDHGPNPSAGYAYTKSHIDSLAGKSKLVDPKGLMRAPTPRVVGTEPTLVTPSSRLGEARTVVTPTPASSSNVRPSVRPVGPGAPGGTAITRVDTPLVNSRR